METLRIAAENCRFLPPRRVTDDTGVLTLKNLVFEPLLRWRNGRALPGLFARWEHDGEGRRWRFHLRDDARFHDGKRCTVDDVLGFIDGILQSVDMFGMKWSYARYLAGARMTAERADILALQNPEPFADVLDIFSEFFICRETSDGRPILGTGRYRVDGYENERQAELSRVLSNRGPSRISFRARQVAEERLAALESSESDVAMNLERLADPMRIDSRFTVDRVANTLSVIFYLNCFGGLFANPAARIAVNHAVDRDRIIRELFHGLAVPAATIVSPFHLGAATAGIAPIAFDRDRARAMFEQCLPSSELVIRTPRTMPEKADAISAMLREDLAAIGIRARLDVQEDRPEFAREVGAKKIGDMAIFDSSPHSTFRVLDDKISARSRAVWWQGYDDAETDALFAAARRCVDDQARELAYGRCLARLNRAPPWLYLFHPIELAARRPVVGGVTLDHKGVLNVG
jgi:peptide/nickel transport system substrate-binding protein